MSTLTTWAGSAIQDYEQLHNDDEEQQRRATWFLNLLSRHNILRRLMQIFSKTRPLPAEETEEEEEEEEMHPPVFCVEDLEVSPPEYQRTRASTPSDAEISTLKEQLQTLKHMRLAAFEPFEKTLHRAEIVNLDSWIKQLEELAERKEARLAEAMSAAEAAAIAAEEEAAASAAAASFDRRRR